MKLEEWQMDEIYKCIEECDALTDELIKYSESGRDAPFYEAYLEREFNKMIKKAEQFQAGRILKVI